MLGRAISESMATFGFVLAGATLVRLVCDVERGGRGSSTETPGQLCGTGFSVKRRSWFFFFFFFKAGSTCSADYPADQLTGVMRDDEGCLVCGSVARPSALALCFS